MPENIAVVRDKDGTVHYASRTSPFVVDGLADGSLVDTEAEEGSNAAAEDAAAGDNLDSGKRNRRGSGDRQREASSADNGAGEGVSG
jgi:hypothetical protein